MLSKQDIEKRLDHFKEVLKCAGVKLTHQRIEIFRELAGSDEHPDADTIFRRVRKRMSTISLDTIYRTLWLLNDLGLINTVRSTGNRVRFDANIDNHHHFICRKCGLTMDLSCGNYDKLEIPKEAEKLGSVETTHVEFRGLCSRCSGNHKKQKK